jgi:hypothetical protein
MASRYFEVMERAERAYHSVAQTHLHEFADPDRALYPSNEREEGHIGDANPR